MGRSRRGGAVFPCWHVPTAAGLGQPCKGHAHRHRIRGGMLVLRPEVLGLEKACGLPGIDGAGSGIHCGRQVSRSAGCSSAFRLYLLADRAKPARAVSIQPVPGHISFPHGKHRDLYLQHQNLPSYPRVKALIMATWAAATAMASPKRTPMPSVIFSAC